MGQTETSEKKRTESQLQVWVLLDTQIKGRFMSFVGR